jgi:hypothetical protein
VRASVTVRHTSETNIRKNRNISGAGADTTIDGCDELEGEEYSVSVVNHQKKKWLVSLPLRAQRALSSASSLKDHDVCIS